MIVQFTQIVDGLRVYPERMLRNLDASFGLVFSQPVLLASGRGRREPRRRVPHRAAQRDESVAGGAIVPRAARRRSRGDARCSTTQRLDACFDLKRALANVGRDLRRARRRGDSCDDEQTPGCRTSIRARCASSTRSGTNALLMVASDRISVFDVVLPDEIPDKGRVLTGAVAASGSIAPPTSSRNHVISCDPTDFPETAGDVARARHARAGDSPDPARVRRARLPVRRRLEGVRASRARSAGSRSRRVCSRPNGCPSRCSRRRRRPRRATTCRSPPTKRSRSSAPTSTSSCSDLSMRIYALRRRARRERGCDPRRHQVRVR